MIVIAGLGNPGTKYSHSRHNIGFKAVNKIKEKNNFNAFRLSKKFQTEVSEGKIANKKIILAKPRTFMNESGKAAAALVGFYKIKPENLWVIHDDIDIPLGEIRIAKSRGTAGHKGVQSIIDELKTKNFVRFRIGIKPGNSAESGKRQLAGNLNVEKFVLQKFTKEEEETLKKIIDKTAEAVALSLEKGIEKAMNFYNRQNRK